MLFSSSVFLFAFLPVVLLIYYVPLRSTRWGQNVFLLMASLCFYAFGEPTFVLVMMASIIANWLLGLWVAHYQANSRSTRFPVVCAIVLNLALLFVFKYLSFVLSTLNSLGAQLLVPVIELPIGISFFTFQALSYVFDVARSKAPPQRNLLTVGLYISFFPQLIAGPIVKYETVAEQFHSRRETWNLFSSGVCRFLTGLGKKVLLSNQLALVADTAFSAGNELTTVFAWLGSICYSLQIYYDFSGYSDMAIGLGRMFGFEFLENFNHPYAAVSITDYWRRWHISLSSFFREYIYIPLGGNRVSPCRQTFNMFVVWLLTGIWHGANWTFILWGLFFFVLLWAEKHLRQMQTMPHFFGRIYTLLAVNFSFVIFRATSVRHALNYLLSMFGLAPGGFTGGTSLWLAEYALEIILGLVLAVPSARWLREKLYSSHSLHLIWDVCYAIGLTAILILSAILLIKGSYNPFIYFNF